MNDTPETPGEYRVPELPRNSEWRPWYRGKVWAWLRENKGYWYSSIDSCLANLEEDPLSCEPAVALFWSVYLADDRPILLTEKQIGRIKAMLDEDDSQKDSQGAYRPFVRLLLSGTLTASMIRPGVSLNKSPAAMAALEAAGQLRVQSIPEGIDRVERDLPTEYWGRVQLDSNPFALSGVLINGILAMEFALWQATEEKYEEALQAMRVALRDLYRTQFHTRDARIDANTGRQATFMPWIDRTFSYLPHSWGRFDPQDAASVFEGLKTHADKVRDWHAVRHACEEIGESDLVRDEDVTDKDGTQLEARIYWEKAATFSECQMPSQESVASMSLKELIAAHESDQLERKATLRWDLDKGVVNRKLEEAVLKSVAAFANSHGGTLLIGVANDGAMLGLEHDYSSLGGVGRDKFELHLRNLLNQQFGVGFVTGKMRIRFHEREGKELCEVGVSPAEEPIVIKMNNKNGQPMEKFYVRSGNSSQEIPLSGLNSYWKERFR